MQLTKTRTETMQSETARRNRQLVLRAFATLHAPIAGAAGELYTPDARFVGPARAIWGGTPGVFASPCLDIESMEMQEDRVLTQVTVRQTDDVAAEARGLFVHRIADGRIAEVSSFLRQQ